MSRIGKKPIPIPPEVQVEIQDSRVRVQGPKGELDRNFRDEILFELKDGALVLSPKSSSRLAQKLWGTYASQLTNMLEGVRHGFQKKLELQGIGFRAQLEGKNLLLSLGFSKPVPFSAPQGITFQVDKNIITISGLDKEKVGEVSARLRALKKPEPYKGKGIRYEGEQIRRKAGKKAVSATT